jgi:steroid delta-isomerase-like uncharacterized protein
VTSRLEENKAIVRRLVEAMDRGDLSVIDSLFASDVSAHFMDIKLNLSQIKEAAAGFNAAFPDLRHTIEDLIAEGDRVVLRARDRGTHRGPYRGIPATGRPVEFDTIAIYRIENGKVAEVWQQMDVQALMKQLRSGEVSPDSEESLQ